MPLLYYVQNSLVSILVLVIILFYVLGQGGKRQAHESLFVALLVCALSIVILELCIDLLTGRVFWLSRPILLFASFFLYMGNPLLSALYLLYLDQLRRRWERIPLGLGIIAFVPCLAAGILCLASLFNGMVFFVDANSTYHRGPLFHVITLIAYGGFASGLAYLFRFRNSFKDRAFSLFLFLPLPLLVGSILQLLFYGVEVAGIGLTLTLLVIYLQMQSVQANKDYLTRLYNRSLGEQYLHYLFSHQKKSGSIGGILMDINGFKLINDLYGHDHGDNMLRLVSLLLVESFGSSWFISRYGGDEFLLAKEGVTREELERDLAFFHEQLDLFNAKHTLPIPLSISVGAALSGESAPAEAPLFIKTLDTLMYEAKRSYHAQQLETQSLARE
ncbi:MAG: GGDEF domain-containing protein [Sphaerochaeta sp.]|nr:GGDEF domain-containing protein [Sphaerochaeta sp.]